MAEVAIDTFQIAIIDSTRYYFLYDYFRGHSRSFSPYPCSINRSTSCALLSASNRSMIEISLNRYSYRLVLRLQKDLRWGIIASVPPPLEISILLQDLPPLIEIFIAIRGIIMRAHYAPLVKGNGRSDSGERECQMSRLAPNCSLFKN